MTSRSATTVSGKSFSVKLFFPFLFSLLSNAFRLLRIAHRVPKLASRVQLDHTTRNESCLLLLLISMSFDEQSAPTKTRSLRTRKRKKGKTILQKEFPENIFSGRIVVCDRHAAEVTRRVRKLVLVVAGTYRKAGVLPPASVDLHVVRRTIRINQNEFSLCEKEEKTEEQFYKKNSR
jgi:hypothetical protein